MKSVCSCVGRCSHPAFGMLVLRVITGALFVFAGYQKLADIPMTQGFFATLGVYPWLAPIIGAIEVVGGIALILGAWTCLFSILLSIIMVGAIVLVKMKMGGLVASQFEFLLLAALIAIKSVGPGLWAVGSSCGCGVCRWGNKCKDCGHGKGKAGCECDCHGKDVDTSR